VRVFVLPIEGEVNVRRVVMSAATAPLAHLAECSQRGAPIAALAHWLLASVQAAAAAPPIGEVRAADDPLARRRTSPPLTGHASAFVALTGHASAFVRVPPPMQWPASHRALSDLEPDGAGNTLPDAAAAACAPCDAADGLVATLYPVGSGKTRIVLTLAATDALAPPPPSPPTSHAPPSTPPLTLVLCPGHLRGQWQAEAAALGARALAAVVIEPFERLLAMASERTQPS
jgi:hypothetical protein